MRLGGGTARTGARRWCSCWPCSAVGWRCGGCRRARRRRRSSARAARRGAGDARSRTRASATTRSTCSCAATSPRLVLTADLNRLLGLEGCLSGNVPEGATAPGRDRRRRARRWRARSRCGSSTGRARSSTPRSRRSPSSCRRRRGRGRRRPTGPTRRRGELALSTGRSQAEATRLGKQAEQLVYAEFARELLALNAKYGLNLTRRAEGQRPGLRLPARVRSGARRARAEGAVRLSVPVGGLGADLGAAEGRAHRRAARRGRSRSCATAVRDGRLQARRRRHATS